MPEDVELTDQDVQLLLNSYPSEVVRRLRENPYRIPTMTTPTDPPSPDTILQVVAARLAEGWTWETIDSEFDLQVLSPPKGDPRLHLTTTLIHHPDNVDWRIPAYAFQDDYLAKDSICEYIDWQTFTNCDGTRGAYLPRRASEVELVRLTKPREIMADDPVPADPFLDVTHLEIELRRVADEVENRENGIPAPEECIVMREAADTIHEQHAEISRLKAENATLKEIIEVLQEQVDGTNGTGLENEHLTAEVAALRAAQAKAVEALTRDCSRLDLDILATTWSSKFPKTNGENTLRHLAAAIDSAVKLLAGKD
jgi:hypothetical protein